MDSELSIDEIVSALHLSLQETLKVSLGPFVDKFNSSREQFNVVSDLLKQLPEYKDLIKQNTLLLDENTSLKNYIKQHCKPDNHIELKIIEKEAEIKKEEVEIEQVGAFADGKLRAKYIGNETCIDPNCEDADCSNDNDEVEVVKVKIAELQEGDKEVEVVELQEEEVEEEEEEEVEEEEEEEVEEEEEEEVEEVEEVEEEEEEVEEEEVEEEEVEEEEEEVEEEESEDDEISNNDSSQEPRMVVKTSEEPEQDEEDEEEEEEGVFLVDIDGEEYFVDDDENGNIYKKISDEEPSEEPIGELKDGVATFF